jgi:MSHA biogenesis protein MshQ
MTLMNAGKWWLRMLLAALLLWGAAAGQAGAAIVVNSILVNNGSSATVAPGASITVTVTVTLTGGTRWRSTAFTTSPASSSLSFCSLSPDINSNGTWTRTFTMSAPSSANLFSLNVAAWTNPNCNGVVSPTKTLPDGINTNPAVAALDHVRIKHDGNGLTCSPEPITLEACANASCTTKYTGNVSVTLGSGVGTWSANPVTITGGSAAITLSNSTSGPVTLGGSVTSPAAVTTGAVCYNGSTANACTLTFSTGSCFLDAVEVGKAPNTPIYTKLSTGTFSLDVLSLNGGVIDATSRAKIDATLVKVDAAGNCSAASADVVSPTVSVTLNSANAGRAALTFAPNKAARVVRVRMVSGSLVGCSSDNFAIRPSSLALAISNINTAPDPASATAVPVLTAGSSAFTMEAQVSNGYDGAPLINQKRVDANGLTAGAVAGAFTPASLGTTWKASGNAFTYSEVGYFKLLPYAVYDEAFADIDEAKSPKDCFNDANFANNGIIADPNTPQGGLLGCYFGSGVESSYFGRYIPARLVLSGTGLTNRSAISTCATASTFTYMGEPMLQALTLTAQNGAGGTTENYEGAFARLNLATGLGLGAVNAPASGTRTPFAACGATPAHPCVAAGAPNGAFDNGVADLTLPLTVFRGASPAGPYDSFTLGVAPVDSDLVQLASYDVDTTNVVVGAANHALVGSTLVRYGRMQVDNAYGSELLDLSLKLSAQFWNLTGYATNALDSCTDPLFKNFLATDYFGGLNAGIMPDARRGAAATLVNGVSKMVLAKPSPAPASKGSVTVRSDLDYLPGSGRATFGVYKAGPVIYVRETY